MTNNPTQVKCPSCDSISTYDAWYEISNDWQAICPLCDSVIDYGEFEEETGISNIQ